MVTFCHDVFQQSFVLVDWMADEIHVILTFLVSLVEAQFKHWVIFWRNWYLRHHRLELTTYNLSQDLWKALILDKILWPVIEFHDSATWLINWLAGLFVIWIIGWLRNCVIYSLIGGWLIGCVIKWLTDSLVKWLTFHNTSSSQGVQPQQFKNP